MVYVTKIEAVVACEAAGRNPVGVQVSSYTPFLDKKLYTDTMYSSEKTPNLLRVGEEPTISANL